MDNKDFLYRIGLSVRKYRTVAGMSQEEFSGRIECDKNTIGKIERGETDSRISTFAKIAGGLGIPVSRLARDSESQSSDAYAATIEYDYLRLFHYCHQLSPEQFNNLCNTAHLYAKGNELLNQKN
ncbi:MAG: helix-turn-helix transcriptional regulator [Lachnospiraceae bacterium]|nr:helix-turn-helix transcriptional regulator [Lachnospiraceae bacterium]